jgi:2-keto-3-deoxy-L-rhamnonate aldolase RhmA
MHEGKTLRDKLKSGQACFGCWNTINDPSAMEILCDAGFDFIIIDAEHGPFSIEGVQGNLIAATGSDTTVLVRVAWNDQVLIKQALDVGAGGILAPLMRSADDVRHAIEACLYPPAGVRGFGPRRPSRYGRHFQDYIENANDNLVIWVQVEHIDAVEHIAEIVGHWRLDGIVIGSNDLSGSMGLLGQPRHPRVLDAIDTVLQIAQRANLPVGIPCPDDAEIANEWLARGMRFVMLGDDTTYIRNTSRRLLENSKAKWQAQQETSS